MTEEQNETWLTLSDEKIIITNIIIAFVLVNDMSATRQPGPLGQDGYSARLFRSLV